MTKVEELDYLLDTALRHLQKDPAATKRALDSARKKLGTLTAPAPKREGLNPVTLRGLTKRDGEQANVSIGRLGVGPPGEEEIKVTFVFWRDEKEPLATMVIDQEKFIEAMSLLFPQGELNDQALMLLNALRSLT